MGVRRSRRIEPSASPPRFTCMLNFRNAIVLSLAFVVAGCARPTKRIRGWYYGPTDPMVKVVEDVNRNNQAVPTIRDVEQNFRVDPAAGRKVFDGLCSACHSLGGGKTMGPDLSAIGG